MEFGQDTCLHCGDPEREIEPDSPEIKRTDRGDALCGKCGETRQVFDYREGTELSLCVRNDVYGARFFRRKTVGETGRRGIWAMSEDFCGLFFHASRNEIQAPHWSIQFLANETSLCEEIRAFEALDELRDWPFALRAMHVFLSQNVVG